MEISNNHVNPVALEGRAPTRASSVVAVEKMIADKAAAVIPPQTTSTVKPNEVTLRESLQSAVAQINEHMQNVERSLQFTIDEDSGKDVVTVLDKKTEEIIRQFPSEEVLVIARQIAENRNSNFSLMNVEV
jgi:flagellar protein FlaG